MAVYVNNITVNSGDNFYRDFYLDNVDGTPLDLTGYTGSSQIRKHPESTNATATFTLSFVDRTGGRIRLSLSPSTTKDLKAGRYVYDVLFTDASNKKSIVVEGNILVSSEMSSDCPITYYENRFGLLFYNENGDLRANTRLVYGQTGNYQKGYFSDALTDEIKPSQMKDYGVVFAGLFCNCDEDEIDQQYDENGGGNTANDSGFLAAQNKLIRDNIDTVLEYVNNGGVLVVTGEHNDRPNGWQGLCGNPVYYNKIMEALGVSFRQNEGLSSTGSGYGNATKDTGFTNSTWPDTILVGAVGSGNANTFSSLNTNTNQPTKRMYSGWFYQNVGFGAVVMILDSNYFGNIQNDPTFDVGLEHPNVELYGMFRSLIRHII